MNINLDKEMKLFLEAACGVGQNPDNTGCTPASAPKIKMPKFKMPSLADMEKKRKERKRKRDRPDRKPNIVNGVDVIRDKEDEQHFLDDLLLKGDKGVDGGEYDDKMREQYEEQQKKKTPEQKKQQREEKGGKDGNNNFFHTEEEIDNRIKELMSMLEEVSGKVIIWATYRYNIQEITKKLKERYGDRSVESFYGDTKDKDRQQIIDRFQDTNSDLMYLVANPKTGGFGLNLFAANTMIYYSNSYDLEVRLQSEDRIHRIGQKNTCTYIDMITEGTVDDKIVKSLRNKINIASTIMGEDLKKWLI